MSDTSVTDDREAMQRERSRRYAEALAAAAAADERIKVLTEQLAEHEYMRRTAEDEAGAASWINDDGSRPWASNVDTHVYHVGEPEPEDNREFALSLADGSIYRALRQRKTEHNQDPRRYGWAKVGYHPHALSDWAAVLEHAPLLTFTADTDWGLDQLVRHITRHTEQETELRRRLPRDPDATFYDQDDLPRRLSVLESQHLERFAKASNEVQAATQRLRDVRFYADRMAQAIESDDAEQQLASLDAWVEFLGRES